MREAYTARASTRQNIEVHVFPGVEHGCMMRGNAQAFDPDAYRISIGCSLAVVAALRGRDAGG